MAAPHNVEFEAAKFLQKLIHESTDEPAKLATKLYVILQHMKASGKENSMPYQVISRAMETVINQHGLDIEALTSSRLPSSTGPQGESASAHTAACSQTLPIADSKSGMAENDSNRTDGFGSCRPPAAANSLGNDHLQGSVSQRSGRSFDHESPSSIDTKSTNSHSQDRRETGSWEQQGAQKNSKKASVKRKRPDSSAVEPPDDSIQQLDSHNAVPDLRKERLSSNVEMPGNFTGVTENWKQGFKGATNFRDTAVPGHVFSPIQADASSMANYSTASRLDAAGIQMSADRLLQAANPTNLTEVGALRTSASRDTGKAPAIPASVPHMPFKEHHLKQLRAQCLVFLAFRNGLAPKRLHLEIALGNILTKEGTAGNVDGAQIEQISDKGKRPTTLESSCTTEVALSRVNPVIVKNERAVIGTAAAGCIPEVNAFVNETDTVKTVGPKMGLLANPSLIEVEKNFHRRGTFDGEMHSQEMSNSSVFLTTGLQLDRSGMISPAVRSHEDNLQPDGTNPGNYIMGMNKQLKPDMTRWTGAAQNDFPPNALHPSIPHELGIRNDGSSNLSQHEGDILNLQHSHLSTSGKTIQGTDGEVLNARPETGSNLLMKDSCDFNGALDKTRSITDGSRTVPVFESSYCHRSPSPLGQEPDEEDQSFSAGLAPSPKYTLSEKWIMAHQKRKVVNEQKWVHKLQKADQRIVSCFNELKETVSSSEDISAKTRSVIELKKLQLLELQRVLRRNIMNDFFKPVRSELDQLKAIKRNRIGRRLKHVEKFEQKMKEERQKRIRERQKEFFSEIEVHREKLEDVFKFKRERCKGFNRYVKEFHKKKERIHREKNDRIQREKINLLKINDVEGYLRMVQDAKSDRVKQLLKETEKYLQKLGSKLQEAKSSSREVDMDENHGASCDVSSENAVEAEDVKDQAKHYKESNEKYYLIAHSIKESITEQPTGIQGGKLREYQMNGLRWLVSLYNNHLNGILADEMGLGKTVQVISLLCYLMEAKNDRGPFLVVVPSSVLPGWQRELSFWAPGINKIVYAGPPEERRRLFKDCIVHQKFNVLLTTYEYLMNKHDRPKLSKIHWHYVIIDEGHRIKNASCKLNAELKHYRSSHRLLLTGTPLQNSLEELWALLNFLLPNIFNSSEDFSQWFNKPFEGNVDNTLDEALLSEEENLLIINRLHQVLRPFVLRRLKHKVESELPGKIERLVRCEASAYQKLLMKRVEENLGSVGMTKGRAIHNSVMELRNICNHPYLSQLHSEEVDSLIPKHFLPPVIRLCGKLEMLDRLLPKLKETNHRVLFFSTMTRLLDVMEEYLVWKQYLYLRLDGHTSGQDRGALIEKFNQPDSPYFIFLLSIRAGGVGVNLQAADTVIIFDTDWNPQVDLQAQARAHRIGQKKDVLVLRLETVKSVEEQVRAAAEHKLGVANQSITAGFFDNNTSAEDRREYLESLLRESKKEEAAPVLDDDSLNDVLARSESEIEVFEAIDQKRREEEMATWKTVVLEHGGDGSEALSPLPSRLVTDDDLKALYEAMKKHEAHRDERASGSGAKRKGGVGGFDSQHYGRGKRAREVRSYEEQWSEEEFEKMCQAGSPETRRPKDEKINVSLLSECDQTTGKVEMPLLGLQSPLSSESSPFTRKEVSSHFKRGRGRPKRTQMDISPSVGVSSTPSPIPISHPENEPQEAHDDAVCVLPALAGQCAQGSISVAAQTKRQGRKGRIGQNTIPGEQGTETVRRRGRKPSHVLPPVATGTLVQDPKPGDQLEQPSSDTSASINTRLKVTSDSSSADGPKGSLPKGSESFFDVSASPLTRKETSKSDAMLAGTLVQPLLDSSAVGSSFPEHQEVNTGDMVAPGQVLSITTSSAGSTAVPMDAPIHIESSQPAASSSELQPSSTTLRTGRRQSQKPQNASEPVRRRGRKRGPSASPDPTPPIVQDQNLHELIKNTGFIPGSSAVTGVSGSTPHVSMAVVPGHPTSLRPNTVLSGAPDSPYGTPKTLLGLQAQGQDQKDKCTETAPRRRGRKSTLLAAGPDHSAGQYSFPRQPDEKDGEFSERKVIATRSRQVNISQTKRSRGEMHSVGTLVSLASKNTMATVSSVQADGIGKPLDTRHTSTVEETKQYGRPSDFPPISSKGRTNVIVLALDAPSLDVHHVGIRSRQMHQKRESSALQVTPALSVSLLKPEVPRLDITLASGSEAVKLDEELSAPPGFETPRTIVSYEAVPKPGEHNDCRTSKSPDVKMGSVVLALESGSQTIDPSIRCQIISEEEETSEVHTIRESGQGTVVPPLPEGRAAVLKAATDNVMSCQPDEDMLAPPGFDIPQQCLSESDAAKMLESDDCLASDVLADPAIKVGVEEICRACPDVGLASIAASTMESKDEKKYQVPVKGDDVAAGTLQFKGEPKSDADVRHATNDASLVICAVDSDTATALTLELKEDHLGPGNAEQDRTGASIAFVAGPHNAVASALEQKEQEEERGSEEGNVDLDGCDVPTASVVVNSDPPEVSALAQKEDEEACGNNTARTLTPESHNEETFHGPCGGHEENDGGSAVESKKQEKSHCLDDGNDQLETGKNHTISHVVGAGDVLCQDDDCHGPGNAEHKLVDASSASVGGSYSTPASASESKELEELQGPRSTEHNAVDASSASVGGPYNAAALTLELKDQEDSHGPADGNDDLGSHDVPATSVVLITDLAEGSALALKEEEETRGPAGSNDDLDADVPTTSVVLNCDLAEVSAVNLKEEEDTRGPTDGSDDVGAPKVPTTSVVVNFGSAEVAVLALKEEEDTRGPANSNDDLGVNDVPTTFVVLNSDSAEVSDLAHKEEEDTSGPAYGNDDLTADNVPTTSVVINSDSAEVSGPAYGNDDLTADNVPTTSVVINSDSAEVSALALKEEEDTSGPAYGNDDHTADNVPTTSVVINSDSAEVSGLALKGEEDTSGPAYGNDDLTADNVPTTSVVINSDSAEVSALDLKEEEDTSGPAYGNDDHTADNVPTTSVVINSDSAEVSALALKEEEDTSGHAVGGDDLGEHDVTTTSVVLNSDLTVVSDLGLREEEDTHGLGDCNAQPDTAGPVTGPSENSTILPMELKEETNGSDSKSKADAGDDKTTSLGSDTVAVSTSESKESNN